MVLTWESNKFKLDIISLRCSSNIEIEKIKIIFIFRWLFTFTNIYERLDPESSFADNSGVDKVLSLPKNIIRFILEF
jgi:hypothetical protein